MTGEEFKICPWGQHKLLQVDSERLEECMSYYRERSLDGVQLSPGTGYTRHDIEFLRGHPYVKGVALTNAKRIDVSALSSLPDLQFLSISNSTQPIDLGMFPKLREAYMEWYPKMLISAACGEMRILHLSRYRPECRDLSGLPEYPRLEDLAVIQSPLVSIDGVARHKRLRSLELSYMSKLERLAAISGLRDGHLETLECLKCTRLIDHDAVRSLPSLRILRFNRCSAMKSIAFLKDLPVLEDFRFMETDVLDGDLTPLLDLPQLRGTAFTNKPHFSHRLKEVETRLQERAAKR